MGVTRIIEHLTDITERFDRILATLDKMECAQAAGERFNVSDLRPAIERAQAHTAGLLANVREETAARERRLRDMYERFQQDQRKIYGEEP